MRVGLVALALALASAGGVQAQSVEERVGAEVFELDHHDVTAPLRDMKPIPPEWMEVEDHPVKLLPRLHPPSVLAAEGDPVAQTLPGPLVAATAGLSFDGVGIPNYATQYAPPDTNGVAGATQYVQWVNVAFAVFEKATGKRIYGPVSGSTLWQGFGGRCESDNSGDPVVAYDKAADRWVMTQFAIHTTPYYQCVAVSTTSDATGSWRRFAYQFGTDLNDYGKLGVWPDAYYISFNMFGGGYRGPRVCALDRLQMLTASGTPSPMQCFQLSTTYGSLLPADLDGSRPPPAGAPNYMLALDRVGRNGLNLWRFHVDWTSPAISTLTGPVKIPGATFTEACNGGACITQPGTTQVLDSLGDRLMYRLAYRNFGTYETLVVNHSVNVSGHSGVRWYEVRNPGGMPVIYQQGTFSPPDSDHRWMGSIAMDNAGNMLLGYSTSGSVRPSVRLTGRLATDPAGMMQAETEMFAGTGVQTSAAYYLSRWGDYSNMAVDPTDDCTFWFTTEYLKADGIFNWSTRIGSFKFPGCGGPPVPDFNLTATPTPLSVRQGGSANATVTVASLNGFNAPVTLGASGLPAGVTATFSPGSVTPPPDATATSVLALAVSDLTAPGAYAIAVSGTSGATMRSATVVLTVTPPTEAGYDPTLMAPVCTGVFHTCDSGSLLNGRAGLGPEPNAPNTIHSSCADGEAGSYHSDESNDAIRVTTVDGTPFAPGRRARIEAKVFAWAGNPSSDHLDLFYAADATSPSWTFLTTLTPATAGVQTLSATYTLPAGSGMQAVRAQFRYLGSALSCTSSGFDDHDDLAFALCGDCRDAAWKHVVGATASAYTLTKTAGVGWGNAGAVSVAQIGSGDGFVDFAASGGALMAGLGTGDTDQGYADIEHAIFIALDNTVQVYESGVRRGVFGTMAAGDRFRVGVEDGVVRYRRNGAAFYTSSMPPTYPLRLDTALYSAGATVQAAVTLGDPGPPQPPVADPGGPYIGVVGEPVRFDGTASDDADGTLVSYAWDFGDGATGTGPVASLTYAAAGTYVVTLTVTDNDGMTATASTTVNVLTKQIVAWTHVVGASTAGGALTKTGGVGWGNAGAVSTRLLAAGDGFVEFTTAGGALMAGLGHGDSSQSYTDIEYGIFVALDDSTQVYESGVARGAFGTVAPGDRFRVAVEGGVVRYRRNSALFYTSTVSPASLYPLQLDAALYSAGAQIPEAAIAGTFAALQPPVANAGGPYEAGAGTSLSLDGSGSSDPDGTVVAFAWDLGDGTTAIGANPTHGYTSPGTYTVALTVTDNDGMTASATTTATIQPLEGVSWTHVVGSLASTYDLVKSAPVGWGNAGAVSTRQIASGDGYVEFTPGGGALMAGLGHGDSSQDYTDIEYAVFIALDNGVHVYESGTWRGTFGTFTAGDRFSVGVEGGVVKYRRNGTLLYTSAVSPAALYPLRLDTALYSHDASVLGAVISGTFVPPQAPVANTGGPYSGVAGTPVPFNGSDSEDPDGTIASFAWDFGDGATGSGPSPTHTYAAAGVFTVTLTVTDNDGTTGSATTTATLGRPVAWTNVVGANASGSWLTKVVGAGWGNAGAVSARQLASGDGFVEFTPAGGALMAGLGHGDDSQSYTDIEYAVFVALDNAVHVYESGTWRGTFGTLAPGERFRVGVEGGVVKYRRNGALFYTSAVSPALLYPLRLDTSLYSFDAQVRDAAIFGTFTAAQPPVANGGGPYDGGTGIAVAFDGSGSTDPDGTVVSYAWDFGDGAVGSGVSPTHTYSSPGTFTVTLTVTDDDGLTATASAPATIATAEPVAWTNVVGATASGSTLTKTATVGWGNAGAISSRQIASGDGFVEFTSTGGALMAGLGHGDSSQSYTDIEYAVFIALDNTIQVYESGVARGTFGTLAPGDRFRVAVEGGVVKYRRNGVVFYTSTISPATQYPLLLDTAIYSQGAQVQGMFIAGSLLP